MGVFESRTIFDAQDARRFAERRLPKLVFDFIDGATGQEQAKRENHLALQHVKLQPRVLVNVENIKLNTTLLNQEFGLPFGVAPMGMCNLVWPNSDQHISDQAKTRNMPHCVSTAASTTMEQSRAASGGCSWFQLYAGTNTSATDEMIDRAEAAGYERLIFTVDTPRLSLRKRDVANGFRVPFRMGPRQIFDFACHPNWSLRSLIAGPPKPMNYHTSNSKSAFVREDSRGGVDWTYLTALRKRWKGKLIVKGVTHRDDALRLCDAGADAIYVSNHGGRQLDSAPAAIHCLAAIRDAVGADYPLLFDSGIRSGDDIVRALAVGANFVMLGRPVLYALGAGGASGLSSYLDRLENDVKTVMAQIGTTQINEINRSVLADCAMGKRHD